MYRSIIFQNPEHILCKMESGYFTQQQGKDEKQKKVRKAQTHFGRLLEEAVRRRN